MCREDIHYDSVLEIDMATLRSVFQPDVDSTLNLLSPITEGTEHTKQFELLFGDKYMLQYELCLIGYLRHWLTVRREKYRFDNICTVCTHFGVKKRGRSLLVNLYCNTVPCTIFSVIHTAVICLLSIKNITIDKLSPRDVAFHFFQNNCVIEGDRYVAQLLRKMQNEFLFHISPFEFMFNDIQVKRLTVIDKGTTNGCPCNRTKNDMRDLISKPLSADDDDKKSTAEFVDKDGFITEEGFLLNPNEQNRLSVQTHPHDQRLDLLRQHCLRLKEFVDESTEYFTGRKQQEPCIKGVLPRKLIKNLDKETLYASVFKMPGDDTDDNENEDTDNEEEDVESADESENDDYDTVDDPLPHNKDKQETDLAVVPLSVFSTCELCLSQVYFKNYEIFEDLKMKKDDLFKGCTTNTIVDIVLTKNMAKLEKYLFLTYGDCLDEYFNDEHVKQTFLEKTFKDFTKHYTECVYARQKFVPIKTLFKSRLDDLRSVEFTNHTFKKLYGNENQVQCS